MPAGRQSVTILIPAYNEGATVADVVKAALGACLGPVIVIDDGSRDDTALRAELAGARVLRQRPNAGKGAALHLGLSEVTTPLVMFLDADLLGLDPGHVLHLAAPVLNGEAQATVGLFTGGRLSTTLASHLTRPWSGQRVLHTTALGDLDLRDLRYAIELAIEARWHDLGVKPRYVMLPGVTHRTKEEKEGAWRGFLARLEMFRQLAEFRWQRVRGRL